MLVFYVCVFLCAASCVINDDDDDDDDDDDNDDDKIGYFSSVVNVCS